MAQQVWKVASPQRQDALLAGEPDEAVEKGVARYGAIPDQMVGVLCLKHNLQRAAGRGSVAPDAAACSGREHSIKSKRNVMGPRSYRNCKGLEL
jgi:hypothetical protein